MKKFTKFIALSCALIVLLLCSCSSNSPAAESPMSSLAPSANVQTDTSAGEQAPAYPSEEPLYESVPDPEPDTYAPSYDSGESYLEIEENRETLTQDASMLTFSLKVDTAAYSNVVRYIESGNLPPADAVRIEEMINYFSYDEPMEFSDSPFAIYTEVGPSPFDESKYMAFIRVKTEDIDKSQLPNSNLTFLIDSSGSMDSYDKLPLLKEAFSLLVETLDEDDKVSIVTYAGSSAVVLDSVSGADKDAILRAINSLEASGSTAGADGILTAYALAEKNYKEGGNNRIILATDGDFNVGISNIEDLENLVAEKRDNGIYLSVLGFGTGNIRDDIMETLSKNGNGNYSYINSVKTAQKVLVDELASNLFTVADDVKAQVEFNPVNVKSYRLLGYENRSLQNRDFNDDTKDAGEIGVGTDVVVMFELELNGADQGLKYQKQEPQPDDFEFGDELFEVRIRYKEPGESESKLILRPVTFDSIRKYSSTDFGFACSVAAFGHLLRDSEYSGSVTINQVINMAQDNTGPDEKGYRFDFIQTIKQYQRIVQR